MTENEAIDKLNNLHYKIVHTSFSSMVYESEIEALCMAKDCLKEIQQHRAIGTVEEVKMLKDFKELYDAYKLIGTIEEFRNLKYKKNVLPIATIKFSKEDMQKIVDEKVAQIELDIQGIRAKAIDEFAEELNNSIDMLDLNYEYRCDGGVQHQTLNNMRIMIQEIAEQLKAGDNNE